MKRSMLNKLFNLFKSDKEPIDNYLKFLIDLYTLSIYRMKKGQIKYYGEIRSRDDDKEVIKNFLLSVKIQSFPSSIDDYSVEDYYDKYMDNYTKINGLNNYIEQNFKSIVDKISNKFS